MASVFLAHGPARGILVRGPTMPPEMTTPMNMPTSSGAELVSNGMRLGSILNGSVKGVLDRKGRAVVYGLPSLSSFRPYAEEQEQQWPST